jgi:Uma2 family endonuclease
MTVAAAPAQTPPAPPPPGERVVLHGRSWESYAHVLEAVAGQRVFVTYDRGRLEIMAPLWNHEWWKTRASIGVRTLCRVLKLPLQSGGSTTFRREDLERGLEPDDCFYIRNAHRMTGLRIVDLRRDPPPDLALEIEGTRSALDRMGIYAGLGVPEVWRYDGEEFHVHLLGAGGRYEESDHSLSFPALPLAEFAQLIDTTQGKDDLEVEDAFQEWVRQHVLPRLQSPGGS